MKNHLNLKINQGAKSARFVVDLKNDLPKEQPTQAMPGSRLEKLAEMDYGKIYEKGKAKTISAKKMITNSFGKYYRSFAEFTLSAANMLKMTRKLIVPRNDKNPLNPPLQGGRIIDQLAFVELGKALYSLLYKICYGVGWIIMFAVRLVYFLLKPTFVRLLRSLRSLAMTKQVVIADKIPLAPFVKGGITPLAPLIRGVAVFAGVLLIIILPVKALTYYKSLDEIRGRVLGASASAMDELMAAGKAAADFDFNQADKNFSRAGASFLAAQNQLADINSLIFTLASIAPDKNIRLAAAGRHILKAGELSSAAGKNLSLALTAASDFNSGGLASLRRLSLNGREAAVNLAGLAAELRQIDSQLLPGSYQNNFSLLKQKVFSLADGVNRLAGLSDGLASLLGANQDKRYLLVFQNNSELRASGGFIGSFAILDLKNGRIKNLEAPAGGSYDTDAGLLEKIKSPEPLRLLRPDWHFWDANWWPDWPASARQLAWFYEHSGGSTVDGVISFTPTVMERLLKIIGPVDLQSNYGLTIDADNFWLETQKLSEQKPDITLKPKKIIGDLMNKLLDELPRRLGKNNFLKLFEAVSESLEDKNILVYFTDSELENKLTELGLDGSIKDTAGDYLNVVNTNIAGQKSDRKIVQQIKLETRVRADGTIIDNLTIKRTHTGTKGEPFTGARNVNWMRIYVPLGAKLISASGFKPVDKIFFKPAEADWSDDPRLQSESQALTDPATGTKIYNEFNKTVFANWSQLDPGQSAEISLAYELPFKLKVQRDNLYSHTLLAQQQPGMNASEIAGELILSDNFFVRWRSDDLSASQPFTGDKAMAALIEKK